MEDKPTNKLTTRKTTPARWLGPVGALPGVHAFLLAIAMLATALAVLAPAASANAPNPTSVEVERYEPLGAGKYKVTVKGTWTWGAKSAENPDGVPNGAQNDCPDTRIGVGYAVSWGDNTANELESKPGPGPGGHPAEKIYVGDSEDNWVHSVTDGEETVAGPYKGHAGVEDPVKESMLGETPEALANAFGDKQGISSTDKGTRSVPTKEDAEDWYSNCGPQAQKTVTIGGESIKIGNSNDASGHATEKELEAGFPNGTWGPISHVYSKSGNYKICPVMYDPHGNHVGEHENNQGEITAGGPGHNGDNSVEGNGNENPACTVTALVPILTTTASPKVAKSGTAVSDSATIESSNSPEGKLTWELFGPYSSSAAIKASSCEAPFTSRFGPYEETVVAGTKVYTTPTEPKPTEPGVYQWVASFTSSNTTKNVSLPFVGCGEAAEQFEVSSEPGFSIEKEQKIAGEASYTKSKLRGKFLGETVEYQIKVSNTGNTELTFNPLTDLKCEKISPEAIVKLAAGKSETYTCEHKNLAVGTYTNQATISDTLESKNSNIVEVEVLPEPSFSIEKEQKFAGEASYRTTLLKGTVGEVVDYKILIKNTGNAPLTMSNFTDTGCTNIIAGSTSIPVNGSSTYTCEYKLTAADIAPAVHKNNATVTGTYEGTPVEHTSNTVEAQALSEESFTIEKTQQLEGAGGFGTAKLIGKVVGEIVEYKIKVTNNGNVPLTFSNFTDTGCEGISGGPVGALAPTASATYTCQHKLTSADIEPAVHKNNATVTGTYEGSSVEHTSNTVEATVKAVPSFTIEKTQQLEGAGGFRTTKLVGKVGEIVEYEITVTNNGNVPLTFSNFTDTGCETIAGGPAGALAPTKSATYTCVHKLTSADVEPASHKNNATVTGTYEGTPVEHTSNTVEAAVKAEPNFMIEKEQRLEGQPTFTKAKLIGKVGETVFYKITVKNTGNSELNLGALSDPNCEGISPSGAVKLSVGGTQVYFCEHKNLQVGFYYNVATIQNNNEPPKESPRVEVEVPAEPGFMIEKEQKLGGSFTKSKLIGKLGETVSYKIIVTNTGNVPLTFGALKDPNCESISPSGGVTIAAGFSQTYTCEHKDLGLGTYSNIATIETTTDLTQESNKVEVEVPAEPSFTIEKEQRIAGETAYTKTLLKAKVGQTVEYKITVKNIGNVELSLGALNDTHCENIQPAGAVKLAVGATETYTCEHKNLQVGIYYNVAAIQNNNEPPKESPKVEVEVPAEPNFTIEKEQRLAGETAYTKLLLKAKVGQTVEYKITVKNIGNVELSLSALTDTHCENIQPSGAVKLAVGATETYTCEHKNLQVGTYYNVATIQNNNEPPKESPKVEVEVPEPSFTIEKEQRIAGEANYTKELLKAKVGQTVEYKITVKNTGATELSLSALTDTHCENIQPSGAVKLAVGATETYTCEHKNLALGTYYNVATIQNNNEPPKESPKVEVEVPAEPDFTVEKEQRIAGEANYTKTLLKAKVGQTVEYKITVKNIGNVELSLGALNDTHCENIQPAGAVKLAVGATETYTCEHKNLALGTYYNVATIQNNNEPPKESPKVEVEVPAEPLVAVPSFTIEKEQKLAGEANYTKSKLAAKAGETVDYRITVKNIGTTELTLGPLTDTKCENIQPSGSVKLAVGATQVYSCEHKDLAEGVDYTNVATIANGSEPAKPSNPVEAEAKTEPTPEPAKEPVAKVKAVCTVSEAAIHLLGVEGEKTKPFKASISSLGIKKITFYIDGKKFKTLKKSQSKNGKYTVTIDPKKYKYGVHKVSVKTKMTEKQCSPVTRAADFVRPKPEKPLFTG